ncbi:hypothetical protein [Streptomyces sp. NPDC058424]|uniref:hypothetical protein n=1 Tax=Streptomyces sp. NPDC058424 TaxID=3346491 RepID=UPI003664C492
MLAQPNTAALLDADRATTDPAVAAERATTLVPVPVPGAVEIPSGIARLSELMKAEADKYRAAIMRGDIPAAAAGLAAVGILYEVASTELGARLDVIEAALTEALRGAR